MYNDCYIRPPKNHGFMIQQSIGHVFKKRQNKSAFQILVTTIKCPASSKLLLALSSIENPLYENVASFQESGQFQSSFLSEPNFVFIVASLCRPLKSNDSRNSPYFSVAN
jgi:hypothetical protein